MRTGRLGNPQVRMIPKMCLKNIQITSDCRSWVSDLPSLRALSARVFTGYDSSVTH